MTLVRQCGERVLKGKIIEVEAYGGSDDPASHAFRRKTPRNAVMFESGGIAYVYFVYGMHHCLNIVTGVKGEAAAILIRALEPLENISGRTDGPARLCAALDIDLTLNGTPLDGDTLWLEHGDAPVPTEQIVRCPRVGINPSSPAAPWPWRFLLRGSRFLSKPAQNR
jgi:DNA-3-methyladenine glycosylase